MTQMRELRESKKVIPFAARNSQSNATEHSESPADRIARLLQNHQELNRIPLTASNIIALQQTVGNKAVQRMIVQRQLATSGVVQREGEGEEGDSHGDAQEGDNAEENKSPFKSKVGLDKYSFGKKAEEWGLNKEKDAEDEEDAGGITSGDGIAFGSDVLSGASSKQKAKYKKSYGTEDKEHKVNPGEGAEILFKVRDDIKAAQQITDPKKREAALGKILDTLSKSSVIWMKLAGKVGYPNIGAWFFGKEPDLEGIVKDITAILDANSGLLTEDGKSRKTSKYSTFMGAQLANKATVESGVGGLNVSTDSKAKAGIGASFDRTQRGNNWENKTQGEVFLGGQAGLKTNLVLGPAQINAGLNASAMAGLAGKLSNEATIEYDGLELGNKTKLEGTAGAKAAAKGNLAINPEQIKMGADLSAMAGLEGLAKSTLSLSIAGDDGKPLQIFAITGIARGNLGAGVRAKAKFKYANGSLKVAFEAGVALGAGGSLGFELQVNFKAIAIAIVQKIKAAAAKMFEWLTNILKQRNVVHPMTAKMIADEEAAAKALKQAKEDTAQVQEKVAEAEKVVSAIGDSKTASVIRNIAGAAAKFNQSLDGSANAYNTAMQNKNNKQVLEKDLAKVEKDITEEGEKADNALRQVGEGETAIPEPTVVEETSQEAESTQPLAQNNSTARSGGRNFNQPTKSLSKANYRVAPPTKEELLVEDLDNVSSGGNSKQPNINYGNARLRVVK